MATQSLNELLDAGVRAHGSRRLKEAAQFYQQVLSLDSNNVAALSNYALLLGQVKEYGQSEALLKRATSLAPNFIDAYVNLGFVLHGQKKYDEAIECCKRALRVSPGNQQLLNNLATNLDSAGRYDEAIALLTDVMSTYPGYVGGNYHIGRIYVKLEKHEEAVKFFRKAAETNPGDALSFCAVGECLLKIGKAEEAVGQFDRALQLNSYDVRVLALKTLTLAELGRKEDEKWLSDPYHFIHSLRLSDFGYSPEEIAALNRDLSEFASNHPSMREDPQENATYKGWHSGNLADDGNPAVEKFKKFIDHAFEQRLKSLSQEDKEHPFVRNAIQRYGLHLWSVKMLGGGNMTPHIHTDGWLSAVYYVDVPSVVNDPGANQAGWIKFGAPRNDIKLTKQPITRTVKPEPGLLVTFPSYIWHDTVPLPAENAEQRLCFAFDLQPDGRMLN